MFYYFNGILAAAHVGMAVVDCGGVGYKLGVSYNTYKQLPPLGGTVLLYSHYIVREDAAELYGFIDLDELECFKSLISVNGVGPKAALAVLSEVTPERFLASVNDGDYKLLTLASGVGPKLAQRIVLELKGKLDVMGDDIGGTTATDGNKAQAAQALVSLGYKPRDAAAAGSTLDNSMSVDDMVRAALGRR